MVREWDYALLTAEAKERGGPDGLRGYYEGEGRNEGRIETAIAGLVLLLLTLGGKWCYDKGRRYFRDKKMEKQLESVKLQIMESVSKMKCTNCQQTLGNGDFTAPWEVGDNSNAYVKCHSCGSENILEGYGED